MCGKGRHQGGSAFHGELIRVAVMHSVGSHQADSAVTVNGVVPTEEHLAMSPSVLDRAEASREVGPILQGFELALRVRIIVRDMRPAVGFADVQIHQQVGDGFGAHAAAAIGMQGQGSWDDALFVGGIGNDLFGEFGRLTGRHHPADDVAREDIQNDVQVTMPHAA